MTVGYRQHLVWIMNEKLFCSVICFLFGPVTVYAVHVRLGVCNVFAVVLDKKL